jgi:ketosteroid isomerase-like protein
MLHWSSSQSSRLTAQSEQPRSNDGRIERYLAFRAGCDLLLPHSCNSTLSRSAASSTRSAVGAGAGYDSRVYRALVRRQVVSGFDALTAGDYRPVVARLAPDVHHVFGGDHALGGERHSRVAVERWFQRLQRLCPKMEFTVHRVISTGPPWDIWAAAEWTGHVTTAAGPPYVNEGVHVVRIRRGRVTYLHAHENSQVVAHACSEMAALGVEEAATPPITD